MIKQPSEPFKQASASAPNLDSDLQGPVEHPDANLPRHHSAWQVDSFEHDASTTMPTSLSFSHQARSKTVAKEADQPPPTMKRIVEAMLFTAKEPLPNSVLLRQFRGLDLQELVELLDQLNREYKWSGRPYLIEASEAGHQMKLRPGFRFLLERLYGGIKEARLSPALVETLSVVAYRQPVTKSTIDTMRGLDSASQLRQLLKRGLIRLQSSKTTSDEATYQTTSRFLSLFKLRSLDELPRSDDLQKL